MATKLKKRNPALAFVVYFLAITVLIGSLTGLAYLVFPGNEAFKQIAPDYKLTVNFQEEMGTLIRAGFTLTTDMQFPEKTSARSETAPEGHRAKAQAKLDVQGKNIAYFFVDEGGIFYGGNTEAQSQEAFVKDIRGEMERSREEFNPLSIHSSNRGYDYLVVIRGNQADVLMNTRINQPWEETGTFSTLSSLKHALSYDDLRQIESIPTDGAVICIAVRAEGAFTNNYGGIYQSYYLWYMSMTMLVILCVAMIISLFVLLLLLTKRQSLAIAYAKIAAVTGWFWVELKGLGFIFLSAFLFITLDFNGGRGILFGGIPIFWGYWLLLNDLRQHKVGVFQHNIFRSALRFLISLESRYPFCARLKRRLPILLCAEIVLLLFSILILGIFSSFGVFINIFVAAVGIFLLIHYLCSFNKDVDRLAQIAEYASQIREGTAKTPLVLPPNSDFIMLAEDLNHIHSGMRRMVDDRVHSEQMKVELITNVSHDLKTPLTSIINYVDLLSKEQLAPEFANDYVKIIAGKSERLKNLVQDLFEISKANSGSMDLNLEQLNILSLVEQTVAELDAQSLKAGVEIKLQLCEMPLIVRADGKKLHRVFENLLGNAVKYALTGTRVYVAVTLEGENTRIVFKNVSSYEMTFSAEEIVERFQRGDTSRTSEGSGLGLAIAKSFLELNGGSLQIELDGDLFKSIVILPLYVPYAQRERDIQEETPKTPLEASCEFVEADPLEDSTEPLNSDDSPPENEPLNPMEAKVRKPDFILYAPATEHALATECTPEIEIPNESQEESDGRQQDAKIAPPRE